MESLRSISNAACETAIRLRIVFSKNGPLTYTSHLDLMRVWERSLRRVGVALAYSAGFNPRPKLQLAAALPLGHTGGSELLDVWLTEPTPVERFARTLVPVLPAGLTISRVYQVQLDEPALQTQVTSAEYRVTVEWDGPAEEIESRVEQILAAPELVQEKRGKPYNLRPLIERLAVAQVAGNEATLEMQLASREGATARPEAVLEAMGIHDAFARHHRLRLIRDPDTTSPDTAPA